MLRGSLWTVAGYGTSQTLRLAGNLVLTRLLFPEAFGLSALVGVLMAGLAMFSDVGIGPSIVRSERGDDAEFLDTAWTIQVFRGVMLWAGTILLAWPLAGLYDQPQLVSLLPVAGFAAVLSGFGSTALFTSTRSLAVGRLTLLEIITQAVTLATTCLLAILRPSVWALVVGGLVGAAVKTALSHAMLAGPRNRFRWDPRAIREISGLARWIFVNSAITFFAMQSDRLMLGRLVSMSDLGVYSLAAGLAQIPRDVLGRLCNLIIFPSISNILRNSVDPFRKLKILHCVLVIPGALISGVVIAAGPYMIHFLYDQRYRSAGLVLSLLTVGTLIQISTISYYSIILAAGKPSYQGMGLGTRLIVILLLAAPIFRWYGVPGIAALTSLSELGVVGFCFCGASRLGFAFPWVDLLAVLLTAVVFVVSHTVLALTL